VFDLDGTLIDSYGAIAECYNHARTSLGEPPLPPAEVRRRVGHGLESLMAEAVGPERAALAVTLFRERYDLICETRTTLLPGVGETLARLAAAGLPMGVATNKPARFAVRILRALGQMPPLQAVAGPGPDWPPKPDPAMVQHVLDELSAAPGSSLYVGDMGVDVETARRAGMAVWVLATGSSSRQELAASRPDRLLERFEELAALAAPPFRPGP
jgi:phosphoglycolate phosphatase